MKKATLFGAIAGDVIGSAYEFRPTKDYNFTLLDEWSDITDDSIMTIAVADWILSAKDAGLTAHSLTSKMQHWAGSTATRWAVMEGCSENGSAANVRNHITPGATEVPCECQPAASPSTRWSRLWRLRRQVRK